MKDRINPRRQAVRRFIALFTSDWKLKLLSLALALTLYYWLMPDETVKPDDIIRPATPVIAVVPTPTLPAPVSTNAPAKSVEHERKKQS